MPIGLELPVPSGFIISTSAWNAFLECNDLRPKIDLLLAKTDIHSHNCLQEVSASLVQYIQQAVLPTKLSNEITAATQTLAENFPGKTFAVRSSAVGEDSSLSFAGQYCSLLNVGKDQILDAYKQVLASKFSPEAILYRIIKGLDDEETPMAAIVLVMVDARLSGVIATGNPAAPDDMTTLVHSVPGLGDSLMAGRATPSSQEIRCIDGEAVIIRHTPNNTEKELSDQQIRLLAGWAEKIADYYKEPQEIEWSCDTGDNIYLLQARRLKLERNTPQTKAPDVKHLPLLFQGGATAATGICNGPVHILIDHCRSADRSRRFDSGLRSHAPIPGHASAQPLWSYRQIWQHRRSLQLCGQGIRHSGSGAGGRRLPATDKRRTADPLG